MKLLRLPFGLAVARDKGSALMIAGQMFDTHLTARLTRADGSVEEFDLGSGLVTTAGVNFLAGYFNNATNNASTFKFHDSGTGTTAAAIGDVDLQTAAGPTTRATGSQANSTNTYTTVGTISYVSTLAITEWGLFTDATRGSDTMWDRKVFSAINVVSGDSIQFTYVLTITAGG